MREDQIDQAERLETLLQDADLRRRQQAGPEAGTYLSHTHSELGGRFAVAEHRIITGVASPKPPPLPASSPWSGAQPQPGPEPPLGFNNPALDDSTGFSVTPVDPSAASLSAPAAAEQLGDLTSADAPSTVTSGDEEQRVEVRSPPSPDGERDA